MGLAALERVLELDPQYPGARELKADVLETRSQKTPTSVALEAPEAWIRGPSIARLSMMSTIGKT